MDQINCCCCCCCCYIGLFSKIADNKIGYLVKKYCKDLDVELDISSFKVGNLSSIKDSVPNKLRSGVVYKFSCGAVVLVMSVKLSDISQHVCVNICQRTVETSAQRKSSLSWTLPPLSFN